MGGEWKENTEEAGETGMKNAFRADASCGIVLNHVQGGANGAMVEDITQLAEPQTTNYDERWKMIL